jgi:hypothetical protein
LARPESGSCPGSLINPILSFPQKQSAREAEEVRTKRTNSNGIPNRGPAG